MTSKGFWIFFSITLIALGASIFDFQWSEKKQEQKNQNSRIIPMDSEKIDSIIFESVKSLNPLETVVKIHLKKFETGWQLVSPVEDEADQSQVQEFLKSATTEIFHKEIELKPDTNLKIYGFQDSSSPSEGEEFSVKKITFKQESSKQEFSKQEFSQGETRSVMKGAQKNFEGRVYLKPESSEGSLKRVYLAESNWEALFNRELFSFRDKRMLRSSEGLVGMRVLFSPSQEALLALQSDKVLPSVQRTEVRNEKGQWIFVSQPQLKGDYLKSNKTKQDEIKQDEIKQDQVKSDETKSDLLKLDQNKVREALYIFTNQAIVEYKYEKEPTAQQFSELGLKKPDQVVIFDFEQGPSWKAYIGQSPLGQYFAWLPQLQKVVRIAQGDFDKIKNFNLGTLRDKKDPFSFESHSVAQIILRKGNEYVDFVKKQNHWVKQGSSDPKIAPDLTQIEEFLNKVAVLSGDLFYSDLKAKKSVLIPSSLSQEIKGVNFILELKNTEGQELLSLKFGSSYKEKKSSSQTQKNQNQNKNENQNLKNSKVFKEESKSSKESKGLEGSKGVEDSSSTKVWVSVKSSRSEELIFLLESDMKNLNLDQFFKMSQESSL
jgi:hypothetical protein